MTTEGFLPAITARSVFPRPGPTVATRSIKREMLPDDLLGTFLYLASCDSNFNFVTGQTLNVDGGKVNIQEG